MNKNLRYVSLIFIFGIFSTFIPSNKNTNSSLIFPLKKIKIENNLVINKITLIKELDALMGMSLFTINKKKIEEIMLNFNFISGIKIKKIYPNTIKIIISEKKPVAIFYEKKKKFYISANSELIDYKYYNLYKNLPSVVGDSHKFKNIYNELNLINFPLNEIKFYYYFAIDRWDIQLKDSRLIKLPNKDYKKSIGNFLQIMDNKNFKNYKIFDYRIKDQLILN